MIHHKLAYEIASTLGDLDNLKVHEDFTETYQEDFLRKTLNKVMSIPDRKIKKTRGALFTYLVQRNGRGNHSRD
jgi:hypothetical protein